jgi:hypothetical protein
MTFVRERARPGELVYRTWPASLGYAQWAGLPLPWVDWSAGAFGVPLERISSRERVLRQKPSDLALYVEQGFGWLVLDERSAGDAVMRANADRWIADGRARVAQSFEHLRVVELR